MPPSSAAAHICYLGLGSNLGNPAQQLEAACERLKQSKSVTLLAKSPVYESSAMTAAEDDSRQPKYLNSVVKCRVTCAPLQLLQHTQQIERQLGRQMRTKRWQPRLIDIDILWYEGVRLTTPELTLPHPGILLRPFVLYPLRDLAPELELAADNAGGSLSRGKVKDLALRVEDNWHTVKLSDE